MSNEFYPEMESPSVSRFLRQQLNEKGLSISELARLAKVNRSNLNNVITETVPLSAIVGVQVAIALNLPPDTLLIIKAKQKAHDIINSKAKQQVKHESLDAPDR
jgi:plasmid maintenance system antidote protein VapI